MGARIDWRRSFITTDVNPYYDSFVRWQMNKLKALDKVKFGERYTIYSPKDDQPCMDHDRSEGEALGPQEYTALKMEVVQWGAQAAEQLDAKLQGKKVFFIAATLRPETMYGQTNCYVGPTIEYGLFAINDTDVYLCTERAARNMAFQGITSQRAKVDCIAKVQGSSLLGTLIKAPNAVHEQVYILPMETVLATKGTGVVTSVPSDSPDDWATLMDLRKKAEYYKIDPKWAALDPFPVISTPGYGNMIAEALVTQMKIQSPKDKVALAEAKDVAYKEGFYNGTMLVGDFKGQPVQEAKPKVREEMIKAGVAFAYAEPEGRIVSRSADECVVALLDQWYIDYGEESWKAQAKKLVKQMNCFQDEIRRSFEAVLDWLHQWACARSYGLGSKLPWDPQFLVESLSDSTIYMAYYTVAHHLQGGVIDGSQVGPLGVKAEDMTDEVWDYILSSSEYPAASAKTTIIKEKAELLRREFRYFYPFNLRSSGKDLIPNHLTFCVYNHAALFPEHHWPEAMRINGHLMLNGKKMAKSTGNALTMRQAVEKFGADACRLSLADAGDNIEDANFEEKAANANILRLHTLLDWCIETYKEQDKLRTGPKNLIWDRIFENEINSAIAQVKAHYDDALYKGAIKFGFYEFQNIRDAYREATAEEGMHRDLVLMWIRIQALLVMPVAPHFSEHIWKGILGEKTSVQNASWPAQSAPINKELEDASSYIRGLIKTIRDAELNIIKRKAKGKDVGAGYNEKLPKAVKIYVAQSFPQWQDEIITYIKNNYDEKTGKLDFGKVALDLKKAGLVKNARVMPFAKSFQTKIEEFGPDVAFNRKLPFNETETIQEGSAYLKRTLKFGDMILESAEETLANGAENEQAERKQIENAQPGSPAFVFYNV
jgi:leucyl-tRNA synthetase